MSKIKIGLSGLSPICLVNKAQLLVEKMSLNDHFPNPEPSIDILAARKDILADYIANNSFRDSNSIKESAPYKQLLEVIRQLAAYVSRTAQGDREILLSSGFEVQSKKNDLQNPGFPENIQIHVSDNRGSVKLNWEKVSGKNAYVVQISSTNPETADAVWVTVGVTSKNELNIQNLNLGMQYYFRVKTVGKLYESPYSNVAAIWAA